MSRYLHAIASQASPEIVVSVRMQENRRFDRLPHRVYPQVRLPSRLVTDWGLTPKWSPIYMREHGPVTIVSDFALPGETASRKRLPAGRKISLPPVTVPDTETVERTVPAGIVEWDEAGLAVVSSRAIIAARLGGVSVQGLCPEAGGVLQAFAADVRGCPPRNDVSLSAGELFPSDPSIVGKIMTAAFPELVTVT